LFNFGAPTQTADKSVPFPPAPDSDPFYAQPSPFPNLAPGSILAARAVTYAPVGGTPLTNPAWEIKFVSRDTNMKPIAAVATVVEPLIRPTGPLLAVAYAEDGLGSQCAPSHAVTGSTTDSNEQAEAGFPLQGLAKGWILVYPDYEGPFSAFASSRLEGHITLDSIRAAERFAPLGLSRATPVGMTGYSGGAIAMGWAASLEREYAPDLNIVAIASGGTPANFEQVAANIDTNPVANAAFFSLILSSLVGLNRSFPQLLTPILNAKGVAAATSLENGCVGQTSNGASSPTGLLTDYTTVNFFTPPHDNVMPLSDLPLAGHPPVANVFVYHSKVDELIPIAGATTMVRAWCASGSSVEYYRGVGDHVSFEVQMVPAVYAYLASRFKGTTAVPTGSAKCNQQ